MGAATIVQELRVRTPCPVSWDDMAGDDRVRFCQACSRSVYNVMAMTSDEVVDLIAAREGRLCMRLYRRADGTVVTADCQAVEATTTPPPKYRPRRVYALAIVLVALLTTWMRRDAEHLPPSGSAVAWDDWVQWAAVSLGIRPAPSSATVFYPPGTIISGDMF